MAQQNFFPFNPTNMSWSDWNGNLVMYYSEQPIPYTPDELDWKLTAKNVAQLPNFSVYPVPDPDLFDSWQNWASEFTLIINGPSTNQGGKPPIFALVYVGSLIIYKDVV